MVSKREGKEHHKKTLRPRRPLKTQRPKKRQRLLEGIILSRGPIFLKIAASQKDWKVLESALSGHVIFSNRRLQDLPPKNAYRKQVIKQMKIQAALLYDFLSYWFKSKKNGIPLLDETTKLSSRPGRTRHKNPDAKAYTADFMDKVYRNYLGDFKMPAFSLKRYDPNNIYITYVVDGRKLLRQYGELLYVDVLLGLQDVFIGAVTNDKRVDNPTLTPELIKEYTSGIDKKAKEILFFMHALSAAFLDASCNLGSNPFAYPDLLREDYETIRSLVDKVFPFLPFAPN